MPEFLTKVARKGGGLDEIPFFVDELESAECPVSILAGAPEIRAWLEMESESRRTKEAAGATFCGPDSGRWFGWWSDVVTTIESARVLIESARIDAQDNGC